jgi:hypothetical protein
MTKEELKTLVKKYFNLTEINTSETNNEEVKEQSFAEATLADGTKVTNMSDAEFEVGQILHVITESGEHVIAPAGEHDTESGISITVDETGTITGIARPDQEGEGSLADHDTVEEQMSEEVTEEVTEEPLKEELAEEEEIVEQLEEDSIQEAVVSAIAEIVAPEIEALKSKLTEHEELLKKYMSEPASEPVEEAKAKFSATITPRTQVWDKEPFNQKRAQYDMILKHKEKQVKSTQK